MYSPNCGIGKKKTVAAVVVQCHQMSLSFLWCFIDVKRHGSPVHVLLLLLQLKTPVSGQSRYIGSANMIASKALQK